MERVAIGEPGRMGVSWARSRAEVTRGGAAVAASLGDGPPPHGTKIIAVGATRFRYTASWAAPLTMSRHESPSALAEARTLSTSFGSKWLGAK